MKKIEGTATSSFISCFASVFTSADIIFYSFLELHSTLSEKHFCHKFSFLKDLPKYPQPLNSQNLLRVTKVFLSIFPKMPSEFVLIFVDKILQKHLLCISSKLLLVFFSEHISRTAILTQVSVITCE